MKARPLYLVLFQNKCFERKLYIGYLPLDKIPKGSILRKAIFSSEECLEFSENGALKGIYEKRKLAEEHRKIEAAWRTGDTVWVLKIEGTI